jgi:hypothetical protein
MIVVLGEDGEHGVSSESAGLDRGAVTGVLVESDGPPVDSFAIALDG